MDLALSREVNRQGQRNRAIHTLVVCTFVNLNGLSEHVKHWKVKNRSLHWFGLTELNKTMGSVCGRKMAENR